MGDSASAFNHLSRGRRRSNTFAPAFAEQSANRLGRVEVELIFTLTNRLGRVEVELIFTLTKVVIVLNLHEQRFKASMREAFELVTAARRHAGLPFLVINCQK
jgi:hypothetical protein